MHVYPVPPPRPHRQLTSRWLLTQVQVVHVVCFGSKKRSVLHKWHKNFADTGCSVCHAKSPGCPYVYDAAMEQLKESFFRSPRSQRDVFVSGKWYFKCYCVASVHLKAYKLSIVQHLMGADKVVRKESCLQMFHRIQDDERFLDSVMFSDESTFHDDDYRYRVSGHAPKVRHSTVRPIWPRRAHSFPARRRTPTLPWKSTQVPQHLFPRLVDW
jgi:hypothetical protein